VTNLTVSLDALGGDFGVPVVAKAAVDYLEQHQDISIILVGDQDTIRA
jgi:glycerol-3-phosphate acyltransferase PlsX